MLRDDDVVQTVTQAVTHDGWEQDIGRSIAETAVKRLTDAAARTVAERVSEVLDDTQIQEAEYREYEALREEMPGSLGPWCPEPDEGFWMAEPDDQP